MSFLEIIFDNLRNQPELTKTIEVHSTTLRGTDGGALLKLVAAARGFIAAAGVGPGDRVALLAPNSTRWIAADLAVVANGAIVVPLYDRQEPRELAVMLRSAEPALVLCSDENLAAGLREAWQAQGTSADLKIGVFEAVFDHAPSEAEVHAFAADDTVAIIYTSGTSGEPKGVMLTRANIDFMIPQTIERLGKVVRPKHGPDRVFHYLPFCFAASRMMLWTQLSRPNPIMLSTDLNKLVVEMATAKPHYFLNVPAVLERIRSGVGDKIRERAGVALKLYDRGLQAAKAVASGTAGVIDRAALALAETVVFARIREQIGSNLEFLISGSAPLAEETQRWFQTLGIPVYQAYGLTETTGIVTLDEAGKVVAGRVGTPIAGVEVEIGDDQELLVSGQNVFSGYWRNPDETAKVLRDGKFHTGDQVDLEDGNLKIIGRVKNLLVPESGHNVAPEPLEEAFAEHCKGAVQCMVVGHGRPFLAILVTGTPEAAAVASALDKVNAGLPFYRKLRRSIVIDEPFTPESGLLTANLKLRRAVIEARYRGEIDAAYAAHRAESAKRKASAQEVQQ